MSKIIPYTYIYIYETCNLIISINKIQLHIFQFQGFSRHPIIAVPICLNNIKIYNNGVASIMQIMKLIHIMSVSKQMMPLPAKPF